MTPVPSPRWVRRWLDRWLPVDERAELIGDLDEEFAERASQSPTRARLWYWHEALFLLRYRRHLTPAAARQSGGPGAWTDFGRDLIHGWRALMHAPIFFSVAVLSLVVTLGLSAAVLSLVRTVLLEPLAVPTANRVVRLAMTGVESRQSESVGGAAAPARFSDLLLGAWLGEATTLEAMAQYDTEPRTVQLDQEVWRTDVAAVGAAFFNVLPVRPAAGRELLSADWPASAARVAVISSRLALSRSATPSALVGRNLIIDGALHEVVGVLPDSFEWPSRSVDVWLVDRWRPPPPTQTRQAFRTPLVIGLMTVGATPEDVRREGQALADRLTAGGSRLSLLSQTSPVVAVTRVKDELIGPVRPALVLLVGGTVGVLLAASVTLAGFLGSRNVARRRERVLRQALGASRWRLVRPLVAEQAWVAGLGVSGGLLLAALVLSALPAIAPADLPRLNAVALDGWSVVCATALALVAVLLSLVRPLRETGADRRPDAARTRSRLIVAQVCAATVLLVGSTLVGRSLMQLLAIDLGYRPEGVLTFQVGLTEPRSATDGQSSQFYEALLTRLRALPSVVAAGTSNFMPLHGHASGSYTLPPPGSNAAPLYTQRESVGSGYFEALGARLVSGRFFNDGDHATSQPVAIVNEAYVRTFLNGTDPLGAAAPAGVHRPVIVGVVAPIKRAAATEESYAVMYRPARQTIDVVAYSNGRGMGVAVRTTGDPAALAGSIRAAVHELAPGAPIHNLMRMDDRVMRTYAQPRFFAIAVSLFAALALATTMLGVYGSLAAAVERRRRELGIRRALGATARDIRALVAGQSIRRALVGAGLGMVVAALGASWGRAMLHGLAPVDPLSYVVAVPGVLLVVWLGAWVPVRTALRVDPARILKAE